MMVTGQGTIVHDFQERTGALENMPYGLNFKKCTEIVVT